MTGDNSHQSATPSDSDSPNTVGLSEEAKDLKTMDSYLKSLPYGCESTPEMQEKLRVIVEKLYICVQTNSWSPSVGWDHMLQYWIIMRYPLPPATRKALVKVYYSLAVTPGSEPRLMRGWADMLNRLIPRKSGSRPKLLSSELELDWRPLWAIIKKQVWASASDADDSLRSDSTTYLNVAILSAPYFPASEIPHILDAILPLYNISSASTVVTAVAAFLPPHHSHLYLPILYKIWESTNSAYIDERILEVLAILARGHMTRFEPVSSDEEDPWKEVGIFDSSQWARISRACLVYMNVPVGPRSTSTVSSTGSAADSYSPTRLTKKGPSVLSSLPTIFVYSIALDGSIASTDPEGDATGFVAGSKALSSLRTIISSIETYFHPSNHGAWTTNLTTFISRLASDFATRWHEEHQPDCKIPLVRRLSVGMKREFVETLKTPALLAMFSKDPICTAYANAAIKYLAALEPSIIMPLVLERSYNGLESVNETHRVTAVLGCLAAVAPIIASEKRWRGGQKHLMPLLELALPGIDINDPTKTVCALAFIAAALSEIKIGDLTANIPLKLGDDAPSYGATTNGTDEAYRMPDGFEEINPELDLEEERTLARDSSAAFPDWIVTFFRRVLAIFEALPEEGGKSNKTGGKLEELLLKTIRSTVDIVTHHLSDQIFDLVLGIVYEYATTTVRANAVKAFGNLIAALAKANPKKTVARFLPYCAEQISIELEHGASSTRTTSAGLAIPSDTSLHWHMAIVRGILAIDGSELLPHKETIIALVHSLVQGTKNERGFSGTGRLVGRILSALTSTYPTDQRFLNPEEWSDPRFRRSHNEQWGKLYRAEEVHIDWHVPSDDEIALALRILDEVIRPALTSLEGLLNTPTKSRDAIWRNDFCRTLYVVRSSWSGLSSIILLPAEEPADPHLDPATEVAALTASSVRMVAGFCITNPKDPRFAVLVKHRNQFGEFLHRAAVSLGADSSDFGDDHIDAVLSLIRSIDTFLLDYAITRNAYASSKKSYESSRDIAMTHSKQKHFSRSIWVKRAQVYHMSRVHTHSLYRRRTKLEETLIADLLEFSLSSYTRARKNAQASLVEAVSYFVRSARIVLDKVLEALGEQVRLGKQADPDKQKGALHILWNRSMSSYAMSTPRYVEAYFRALFSLRSQEKPSIQKLVGSAMDETIGHITAEAMDTSKAAVFPLAPTKLVLQELLEASGPFDRALLQQMQRTVKPRDEQKIHAYDKLRSLALESTRNTSLHWKYQHWALVLLVQLVRRDGPCSPEVAAIFTQYIVSDHPSMRHAAQRGVVKVLRGVKARSLSSDAHDLWLNNRQHPLRAEGRFSTIQEFVSKTTVPISGQKDVLLVDHPPDGPLIWQKVVRGYRLPPENRSAFAWEASSKDTLAVIGRSLDASWFSQLVSLWSQEGDRSNSSTDVRMDNIYLIKHIVKMFDGIHLDLICSALDPVLFDVDKFKQRAAAEILTGLIRGSKHLPGSTSKRLWAWVTPRIPEIFSKLTLDTLTIWQSFITSTCSDRDPRRVQPIVDFILALKVDFQSESVFPLSKSMDWLLNLSECMGPRFLPVAPAILDLYFNNLQTAYAEIRVNIIATLVGIMSEEWRPEFPNSLALLASCNSREDTFLLRDARHLQRITSIVDRLPALRAQRLPGASVSQSLYDKIGLTLLQWIWTVAYSNRAPSLFVYVKPFLPEILRMSELQDSPEVQQYSSGVLYILASITPPSEFIEPLTEVFIEAVRSSPSWRIRHKIIPVLAVWYFRNTSSLPSSIVKRVLDVLVECLSDENVEVRETAASTLSGVLRSRSEKDSVIAFKDRFARNAHRIKLPKRDNEKYPEALRKLHAAVLGMIATLQAYPYVVEPWMPALIERLSRYASEPQPVSTAIRKFAADFKKTHQDTWHIDMHLFDEEQSQALQTIVAGTSYYA